MRVRVVIVLLSVAACSEPSDGAAGVAKSYIAAAAARDAAAVYALLPPKTTARIDALFSTLKKTRALIDAAYPEKDRAAAYEATGTDVLTGIADAPSLFAALFGKVGESARLDGFAALSTRIRAVEQGDDLATVTTWGGDKLEFVKDGESWFVALPADDSARLDALQAAAGRSVAAVQSRIDLLTQYRFGHKR